MSRKLEIRQIELRQAADRAAAAQSRLDSVNEKLKNMDRKVKYKYKKRFLIYYPHLFIRVITKLAYIFRKLLLAYEIFLVLKHIVSTFSVRGIVKRRKHRRNWFNVLGFCSRKILGYIKGSTNANHPF